MTELREFENGLRATLADVATSAEEPSGLADRLIAGAAQRHRPHRVTVWLGKRWVPPALAAAAVAIVAVATLATVTAVQADRPAHPTHQPTPIPTPSTSVAPTSPTSPVPSSTSAPPSTPQPVINAATDWDVDGDQHADHGQLVFLGGYGPNNWELVVDMTSLGRQIVPFSGQIALPGSLDLTIAGSVDADHDGHAEVFVMDQFGVSTQSWTIFKLAARHIVQVTAPSRPVDLSAGATVTHADGFRCAGNSLITTSETTGPPDYKTISYRRVTYAWDGTRLQQTSQQAGTFTGTFDAGVACGDLPQHAPNQPYPPQTSPTSDTTNSPPPTASGRWTDSHLVISPHSLGAVTRGMTPAQAEAAAGTALSSPGDGIFRPTDQTITGSTTLQFAWAATCFGATRSSDGPGTAVTTSAGVRLGDPMNKISAAYGSTARPFTADPNWTGAGNYPAGIIVQSVDGVLLFIGSAPDHRGGTVTSIHGAADAFHASNVFC